MNVLPSLRALSLGLLLAGGACQRPEEVPPPAGLLSKEQMVSLLVSQHLLEARIEGSRLAPDSARALFLSQQGELLARENLRPEDSLFERSYRYYAVHGKDLDDLYTSVIDSLRAEQRRLGGGSWDDASAAH